MSCLLLALPKTDVRHFFEDRDTFMRPDIWDIPVVEWLTFLSILLWMLIIMVKIGGVDKKNHF